jgi:aspartyl protease family protein
MRHPDSNSTKQARPAGAGLRWGPLVILLFWLAVMGVLYAVMRQVLKPPPLTVSVTGELVIPRARDGHFYALGQVHGRPVTFLVDTGASLVVVSQEFARTAGMAPGEATTFHTASGELQGRIVKGVTVSVGPASVSGTRVGVGLVGPDPAMALLGQSFLSRFEIVLSGDNMVLRGK